MPSHPRAGWLWTQGRAASRIACQGLTPAASVRAGKPKTVWPNAPAARASPAVSHNTSTSTVMASVWKVFSRHRASVEPRLPQQSTVASVTAIARPICPYDTPPKSAVNRKTGSPAASITNTPKRLARSLPSTNSQLERFVKSRRISVRRSFSWATSLAANNAEKNTTNANCRGARIWNRIVPKRARSPTSRTNCVPVSTSQAVLISTSRASPYAARATYTLTRRGEMATSRVNTGPISKALAPTGPPRAEDQPSIITRSGRRRQSSRSRLPGGTKVGVGRGRRKIAPLDRMGRLTPQTGRVGWLA